jgi:sulfate adenylyltransferase
VKTLMNCVPKIVQNTADIVCLEQEIATMDRLTISDHTAHECEMLANGAFFPLTGFMGKTVAESVIRTMRFPDGQLWPIPIVLAVGHSLLPNLKIGKKIALYDQDQRPIALLLLREKFTLDLKEYCADVLQTTEMEHPGVQKIMKLGDSFIGGEITHLLNRPKRPNIGDQYYLDPQNCKDLFQQKGWKSIVAFHTRNPIHRAHEYLTKVALENFDGLLLHPVVGETKPDDIPADVRMRCYEALYQNYYNKNHVMLSAFPVSMYYSGPREALYHMIIRKNYGCTHIIIGRDHAGVGGYYGLYEAQEWANKYAAEIGIVPLTFDQAYYCLKCENVTSLKVCPHEESDHLHLSGTKVREMLRNGIFPPKVFSRPEVAAILVEWAQSGDLGKNGQETTKRSKLLKEISPVN